MNVHLLARAVIWLEGHILLAQAKDSSNTFLPGGHVEPGEGLAPCLERELFEEIGVRAYVERYLGVMEHVWNDKNAQPQYELNHVFEVSSPDLALSPRPLPREAHLTFFWALPDELTSKNLEPYPLRELIGLKSRSDHAAWWASTLSRKEV